MRPTPARHKLFVYGTLRRRCGHPMAKFLAEKGTFISEAKTRGRLFDLGRYPAAVPTTGADEWIFGDLFALDDAVLSALDDYEGVESPQPSYFGRAIATITLPDGAAESAWVYWFHGPLPAEATRIASGNYEKVF